MPDKKPDWDRLQNKNCPLCGGMLDYDDVQRLYLCLYSDCDFRIRAEKFDKIVNK